MSASSENDSPSVSGDSISRRDFLLRVGATGALAAGSGISLGKGLAAVSPQASLAKLPVDYVSPLIGTHSSRWDFFASACRPSGMVNLSPDTKVGDFWDTGYVYDEHEILCFSHVHGWQTYGIPVMPVCGHPDATQGMKACASAFSHDNEVVKAGYHKVLLQRYDITAELTSTMRVGFHRYTFPMSDSAQILFFTGDTLMGPISSSEVRKESDTKVSGYAVMAPNFRRSKPFTVYFVAQFNKPFADFGGWTDHKSLQGSVNMVSGTRAGAHVNFATNHGEQILMKVAISYVSARWWTCIVTED